MPSSFGASVEFAATEYDDNADGKQIPMMTMSTTLSWDGVLLRLALTAVAGILIGYNRSEHGKAAGMRIRLLVCFAASVSMIQVNILLGMTGRAPDSFVINDLMRLPLGILTGVGFIGGGAIPRRGDLVVGVTTAATIWLGTVIGLCLGGGQLALGSIATLLGLFALWVLKWVEDSLRQDRYAHLSIEFDASGLSEADIRHRLAEANLSVMKCDVSIDAFRKHRTWDFEIREFRMAVDTQPPSVIEDLAHEAGVVKLEWKGSGGIVS
jgi:putative Mg2+ transporter-C (MgtC) family protein